MHSMTEEQNVLHAEFDAVCHKQVPCSTGDGTMSSWVCFVFQEIEELIISLMHLLAFVFTH